MKAISLYSVIPVRAEASEGAEQNTQILFGETFDVLEEKDRWNRVKLHPDGQEGWVDAKMVTPMSPAEYKSYHEAYIGSSAIVAMPMAYAVSENNGQTIPLTAGTRLAKYTITSPQPSPQGREIKIGRFEVLGVGFRIDPGMVIAKSLDLNEQNLLQAVRFFLNIPYLWGGKNAMGMDCSGFTQVVMSLFGKELKRNASEQATQGRKISDLKHVKAGDLVFFDKPHAASAEAEKEVHISHVGIAIDSERVIHCSGRVKVEKLDSNGIFNAETGSYSHHLVAIRRVER